MPDLLPPEGIPLITAFYLGCAAGFAVGLCVGGVLTLVTVGYLTRRPVGVEWDALAQALADAPPNPAIANYGDTTSVSNCPATGEAQTGKKGMWK